MPDSLFLNLWFSDFSLEKMLLHALAVMRQFPFSSQIPGITNVSLHPVSWHEATILEQRFRPGVPPEEAVAVAVSLLHEDYAYVFEAHWDLWGPKLPSSEWTVEPVSVRFIARGEEFADQESETQGEIQVDFGDDAPFLHEELQLSAELESRVRANVKTLVDFTNRVEQNSGASTRLLWSESEENLAQKLIGRLQKFQ